MSETNGNHKTANDDHAPKNTIASKAVARAHGVLIYGQRQVDRVVPPSTRRRVIDSSTAYAEKRPLLSVCQTQTNSTN